MRKRKFALTRVLVGLAGALLLAMCDLSAQTRTETSSVETAELNRQVRDFLQNEVSAHVADIHTLNPPPDRVVGALTTGEFSWGTFMRTLAGYAQLFGTRAIADRDVPQMIGQMAQIELSRGGKTWAQLYAAMALEDFGTELDRNALWQSLTPEQREAYRALLDPGRFYDAKTHTLIHLPENYFGVAARIAAIDYELGLNKDRASVDDLLSRAAKQFTSGALFADDALPTGRYDRYSNEYARAMYEAACLAGRDDIAKAVAPSLKEQMKLWWDLLSEDGYGYPWGRSLGAISYMDTLEITAFLGKYEEFRPAPLSQLAAAYFAAWSWLRNDFNDQTHLLRVFDFGRGDYDYITREREWQQTTTFFGKVIGAHERFMETLEKEALKSFPSQPSLGHVARFEYFRKGEGRQFGVWVVRQGNLHFALPFVAGPRAATSDYEPAPHGLPGFAVPVQKMYPCFVPFVELESGQTIAASDGADALQAAGDGRGVVAKWERWVVPGAKAGETIDPGLVSEVTWSLSGNALRRTEVISAKKEVKIRRIWLAVPTRADHMETAFVQGIRTDRLISKEGELDVRVPQSDWPVRISAFATGNDALGRGDRGAIPLLLMLESTHAIAVAPDQKLKWEVEIKTVPAAAPAKELRERPAFPPVTGGRPWR